MSYRNGPQVPPDSYFQYSSVRPRLAVSTALGLAVTSYIPGLGILAIPALILAAAADGRREHPLTHDRAHRAQAVAIVSICLQVVVIVGLLLLGVSVPDVTGGGLSV